MEKFFRQKNKFQLSLTSDLYEIIFHLYFLMCQHFWVAYKQWYEIQSFRGSRSETKTKNNAWAEESKRRKYNECMHVFSTSRDQEQFSITYKLWMLNISHGKSLKWPAFYLSCSVNTMAKHGIFSFFKRADILNRICYFEFSIDS